MAGGHAGGEAGIRNVNIFDPVSRTWRTGTPMAAARWYPSLTQMADNRMLVLSGQITSGNFANTAEVYNSTANTIATLPFTTPQLREVQYPQTALLPSGKVMSISAEHGSIMVYDRRNSSWTNIGTSQVPYGAWTSLSPGRFLITGGGSAFDTYNPGNPGPSQRTARLLDMTSGSPVWTALPDMANARSFHNVTMLPTGQALAVGGATVVNDFATTGTLTADLFDPTTNTLAADGQPGPAPDVPLGVDPVARRPRLSAGGGRLAPAPDQPNAQIYSPPTCSRAQAHDHQRPGQRDLRPDHGRRVAPGGQHRQGQPGQPGVGHPHGRLEPALVDLPFTETAPRSPSAPRPTPTWPRRTGTWCSWSTPTVCRRRPGS